jgi:hypothetical protein
MKKFLVLVILALIAISCYKYKDINIIPEQIKQPVKELDYKLKYSEVENKLTEIKQKQAQEEMRKLELLKLQKPEIIYQELNKVDKSITYQGISKYSTVILEKKFLYKRELKLELIYDIGIGIDNNKIKVKKFVEKTVVIQIPKEEIKIIYIELNPDKSEINSSKYIWVKQYKPEDIKIILEQTQKKVTDDVNNNRKMFDDALINLKDNIKQKI